YREPPLKRGGAGLVISQSGTTADTLEALRYMKRKGQKVASILNVPEAIIGRESDVIFPTLCGPEIAVASTKALTAQLTVLASLVVAAGVARGTISRARERQLLTALTALPRAVAQVLKLEAKIKAIAKTLVDREHALFLGRGSMYPVALEGALK